MYKVIETLVNIDSLETLDVKVHELSEGNLEIYWKEDCGWGKMKILSKSVYHNLRGKECVVVTGIDNNFDDFIVTITQIEM